MFIKILIFKMRQWYANAYKDYCEMLMWEEENARKKEMLSMYPGWGEGNTLRGVAEMLRTQGKIPEVSKELVEKIASKGLGTTKTVSKKKSR